MKSAIIFGEFLDKSTTGIAYMNTLLESSLKILGYKIDKLIDPRSYDYNQAKLINKKNFNSNKYIDLFKDLFLVKKSEISFITLSDGDLGLVKTFLIALILKNKSKYIYTFIHRGDLKKKFKQSRFKKIFIKLIFKLSNNIIFLTNSFKNEMNFLVDQKIKYKVLSNSLSKKDTYKSNIYFKKGGGYHFGKRFNCIFSSNVQKEKGIFESIEAIKIINLDDSFKVSLDIYGMLFDEIDPYIIYNINYKGKLSYNNRLEVMSKYDFLVLPSETEGFPMIILECMALGIPFITTRVGAIEQIVGKDYPYFCKKEKNSLIKTIKILINDFKDKNLDKIRRRNKKRLEKYFSYENYLDNLQKIIN